MRLNRGLYILAISVFFLVTGSASAGPAEVVRRNEGAGVGHIKTAAEIDRWASELEKRDPTAARLLREAVGKDLKPGSAERKAYEAALERLDKAGKGSDPAERQAAEREYHATLHRALETTAFIAKSGGEISGPGEVAKLLKSNNTVRQGLITGTPAENARVEFALKVASFTGMDADVMRGIHDFHQQLIAEVEANPNLSPSLKANAELENQQTVLFLAQKIGEARRGLVKGTGEAKDAEGRMTSDAEKRQAAETLQGSMDVEFAAGNTGAKAKAAAEALANLLTGKDPVSRTDALAGVKLLHDTFADSMRSDLAKVKDIKELDDLGVDKAKVVQALKGLTLVNEKGEPRPLSEVILEVRQRLKKAGLREAEIEKVIEALRERARDKVIKLIAENKNLDAAGKRELLCGVPSEGRPPCVSEAMASAKAIRRATAILKAAGIDADQCNRDRAATSDPNAIRRGVNPSGPVKNVAPAKRGDTHVGEDLGN